MMKIVSKYPTLMKKTDPKLFETTFQKQDATFQNNPYIIRELYHVTTGYIYFEEKKP